MENIVLDSSKSNHTNIIYKGPVDEVNRGFPLISQGFLNMNCKNKRDLGNNNDIYKSYFQSWNYTYDNHNSEKLEELAPGKLLFY